MRVLFGEGYLAASTGEIIRLSQGSLHKHFGRGIGN